MFNNCVNVIFFIFRIVVFDFENVSVFVFRREAEGVWSFLRFFRFFRKFSFC